MEKKLPLSPLIITSSTSKPMAHLGSVPPVSGQGMQQELGAGLPLAMEELLAGKMSLASFSPFFSFLSSLSLISVWEAHPHPGELLCGGHRLPKATQTSGTLLLQQKGC